MTTESSSVDAAGGTRRSALRRTLLRYPATFFLGGHYLIFGALPAIINGSPATEFIVVLTLVAFVCALVAESVLALAKSNEGAPSEVAEKGERSRRSDHGNAATFIIWMVGTTATIASSIGGPNYATQVGAATVAGWYSLVSPFTSWAILGVGLLVNQVLRGAIKPRIGYGLVALTSVMILALDLRSGLINRAVATVAGILICLFLVGVIRPYLLIVVALFALVSWPVLEELRNDVRAEAVSQVEVQETGFDRIQLDGQMSYAPLLRSSLDSMNLPSLPLLIRTGLIPSVIDSDRPPLDVGSQFNVALGGSRTSSTSATALGNVYVFGGLVGVGLYSLIVAIFYQLAFRWRSGFGLATVILIYINFTSFSSSFPLVIPSVLQTAVSWAVAGVLVWALRERNHFPSIRN